MEDKILLIEDTHLLRFQIRRVLEDNGYTNVIELNSAAAVVKHPQAYLNDVSLIISDIGLPDVNGIDFAMQLREMPKYSNIPIMFISGHNSLATVKDAISAGAVDYFLKPINYDQFIYRINKLLGKDTETDNFHERKDKINQIILNEYDRATRGNTPLGFLVYKTNPTLLKKSQSFVTNTLRRIDSVLLLEDRILVILPLTVESNLPVVIEKIEKLSEEESLDLNITKSFSYVPSSGMKLDDVKEEIFTY